MPLLYPAGIGLAGPGSGGVRLIVGQPPWSNPVHGATAFSGKSLRKCFVPNWNGAHGMPCAILYLPFTIIRPTGRVVELKEKTIDTHGGPRNGQPANWRNHLVHAIDHAAHLLPAQGPITVFIHHNTLHAFEELSFDAAVQRGGEVFGCQPYLSEERYRAEFDRGRIRVDDLVAVLREDGSNRFDESVVGLASRLDLRLAMLQHPVWTGPTAELNWFMAETDALRRVRADVSAATRRRLVAETRRWVMRDLRGRTGAAVPAWADEFVARFETQAVESWGEDRWEGVSLRTLWQVCREGARSAPAPVHQTPPPVRHRDLLFRVAGVDADIPVHDLLIRFCAAFVDQGVSHWPLPERDRGLFQSFLSLYRRPSGPPDSWLRGFAGEAARLQDAGTSPLDSIHESLAALGVGEAEWDDYLSATLLALRGWGGIVRFIEEHGDRVAHPVPQGSLHEFVAVRLLLDRFSLAHAAAEGLGYAGSLADLRNELRPRVPPERPPTSDQRAFPVFQLAQVLGWSPAELHRLTPGEWAALLAEIEGFSGVERRRVFHHAYERRFRTQTLDALSLYPPHPFPPGAPPRFQVITCIDEREESFRRHLEEIAPECETFGAPGFYCVAMYYRGAANAHYVPLCPIVIQPKHWVEEQVIDDQGHAHRRAKTRQALGTASHRLHVGTRTFFAGAVLAAGLGVLATIPLVVRVLFPRLAAHLRNWFGQIIRTPGRTRLKLERSDPQPSPSNGGLGYTLAEMNDIAERLLRDCGLTRGFTRLVLILGHGSHSMNNPHESAHDCGACGGSIGGPNGRAIAQILNDPRVRKELARRGVPVPDDTVFVGGLHNTCNEYVKFFDKDLIPDTHADLFHEAEAAIEKTLDRNAHERARRFESAPLAISGEAARQHMDARAEDLAQVRPEWGHATNAICIVGRRERTRGLYLDRRAFLVSYDPTQDNAEAVILARILGAAVPVCAGISLEYYFCHVDPTGYGCGTKLPHNITSLLGVMDGAASDLRTGLPWQMVEIHEPVRLLFVVETTPAAMLGIMDRNATIGILVRNGWVQMTVLDPGSGAIHVFRDGAFRPYEPQAEALPHAPSSTDWYRGWRDHLEFAIIGK